MGGVKRSKQKTILFASTLSNETREKIISLTRKFLVSYAAQSSSEYKKVQVVKNFLKTGDPKHLEEAIRKVGLPLLCDPGFQSFFNKCQEFFDLTAGWNKERQNNWAKLPDMSNLDLLQMALANKSAADIYREKLQDLISQDVWKTYLHAACEEYIDTISRGLKLKLTPGRSKKLRLNWYNSYIHILWKNFYIKGKEVLEPRYRNPEQKIKALEKFLIELESDFLNKNNQIDVKKIVIESKKYKKDTILKAIFGYPIGLGKKSKKHIPTSTMAGRVDYYLQGRTAKD